MNLKWPALILCGALCGAASEAQAQSCGWPYYGGYSYYDQEAVPYFSLHPPVYYSYPMPRTYGYSPFAYGPGVMTPEVQIEMIEPKTTINPYVPRQAAPVAAEEDHTASVPQRILNPHVAQWQLAERTADVIATRAGER